MNTKSNLFEGKDWAVVGFDHDTAKKIFDSIESSCGKMIVRKTDSKYELVTFFEDGVRLRHIRNSEDCRGYRFGKLWCNKNMDMNAFYSAILPAYTGDPNDIAWL